MKQESKICAVCGKEFTPNAHNQIYCSKQCQNVIKRNKERERKGIKKLVPKKCVICGKEFMPVNSTQTTCGSEICRKTNNNLRIKKFKEKGKAKPITKKCIICGEEFLTSNNQQILCGKKECALERMSREKRNIPESEYESLIGTYTFDTKNKIVTCPICGKEFKPAVWNQKYCSKECKLKRICLDRPNNLYQKRVCVICEKEFLPNGNSQKTCSKKCKKILHKQYQKKRNDAKPRIKQEEKQCKYCGATFMPKKCSQIFCCREHQELFYKESGYNIKKHKELYQRNKDHIRIKNKKRRHTDLEYKMRLWSRSQVKRCLNSPKEYNTFDILGYTPQQLKQKLEMKFKPDMNWNNHGTLWHIDHIKPLCKFNFIKEDGTPDYHQIFLANCLANLQPLYVEENLSKGGR